MTDHRIDDLICSLKNMIEKTFQNSNFDNANGERVHLKVFTNSLPIPEAKDEDEYEYPVDAEVSSVPYALIQASAGSITSFESNPETETSVLFCIYDNGKEKQGIQRIMSMIDKMIKILMTNPYIGNFEFTPALEWALQNDVDKTYPYYYGAMTIKFKMPKICKEDPYA